MNQAAQLFEPIRNKRIMIIGDVMLDHYLTGGVERISPEAPVPIVKLKDNEYRLGGAANVALNVQSFGAIPILFSVVGRDQNANRFRDLLLESALDTSFIFTDASRPTTRKTRILAGYQQLLRVDEEETHDLSGALQDEMLIAFKQLIAVQPPMVIIFQDYNKGMLPASFIRKIMEIAIQEKIPTVVDPKFDQFFDYQGCTLFKPNLKELSEAFGQHIAPKQESLTEACQKLLSKLGAEQLLITLSEHGVFYYEKEAGNLCPVKPREIVDVCGAGDAVIATCAVGIALKMPLQQIARLANISGGIVCESMGVLPVNFNKLTKELGEMYPTFH